MKKIMFFAFLLRRLQIYDAQIATKGIAIPCLQACANLYILAIL